MSDDLIKRLLGKYSIGPKGVYEDRDFGSFTPTICKEAADEIARLRAENETLHENWMSLEAEARQLRAQLAEAEGQDIAAPKVKVIAKVNHPGDHDRERLIGWRVELGEGARMADLVQCFEHMADHPFNRPTPQARVPDGWMLFPVEAWDFLSGWGDLEGYDFGEQNPKREGRYWWRRTISEMLKSQGGE